MAQPSYSFVDLREAITAVEDLRTQLAALAAKVDSADTATASPVVGALVDGAMSLVNQRLMAFEQKQGRHEQHMANLEVQLRAAIPQMPDMQPLTAALNELVASLARQASAVSPDSAGIATLTQAVAKLTQAQQELCARMDKPVVREGVADLPSGQVKLRITETRVK